MLITEYLNILDISADNEKEGLYTFIMDDMKTFARRRHNVLFSLSLLIPAVLFFSCKNNVNTMIDDYNGHFEPATNMSKIKNPGDSGFTSERMLDDFYSVSSEGSINLAAPYKCQSYEWTFYKSKNSKKRIGDFGESINITDYEEITDKLYYYNGSGRDKREFRVYVPLSQLAKNEYLGAGTYVLTLKIVGNDGITYTDRATVVIYEQIYGQTTFFKEEQYEES